MQGNLYGHDVYLQKVRKRFGVKDNAEALKKALDMAAGKIEYVKE